MIDFHQGPTQVRTSWQAQFLEIVPEIEQRVRRVFWNVESQLHDECVQDCVIHCLLAYMRLFKRGRSESVTPRNLVWYAVLQVKRGREAGAGLNSREPLSRYAQFRRKISAVSLSAYDLNSGDWIDSFVADKRISVADQVALRVDLRDWFNTLPMRTNQIATELALGASTAEVARQFGVSAGRVSQLRRELEASWIEYQQ
jgi:hypothetical protein